MPAKKKPDWQIFEEEVAEFLNGKCQKGSGCGPIHKGDVKTDDYLIECKCTAKDYYNLNYKIWEKISDEARNIGKIPLFACRGNRGDFLVGSVLDFDYNEVGELNPKNNCLIDGDKVFSLNGNYCQHVLVSWQEEIKED